VVGIWATCQMMAARLLVFVLALLCTALNPPQASANSRIAYQTEFDGIQIIGLKPPEGATYDFPIIEPREGVEKLIEAMALINENSPFSVKQIAALKKSGPVVVIYDPNLPERRTNLVNILAAIFMPKFGTQADSDSMGKSFPVVVTRFGIKWPLKELAPVLVHELVGHGVQHMEDRLESMRKIDVECEAWLYTEMAHQELGMENFTDERIKMRKNLAFQCDDFFRHLERNDRDGYAIWHVLKPDIPKLLQHFGYYLDDLRRSGVMGETLANAAVQRDEARTKLFRKGSPVKQFIMAEMFRKGSGVRPDQSEALRWYKRAAENGHVDAQRIAGELLTKEGPDRDLVEAAQWYHIAAENGDQGAQYTYGLFFELGTGGKSLDLTTAAKWYAKAAIQGHIKAQYRVAKAFEKGRGVAVNFSAAAQWYRESAGQDFALAQFKLGRLYDRGNGVEQSYVEAFKLYTQSADKVARARFRLGLLYELGNGVVQNFAGAARLYEQASKQGSEAATKRLLNLMQAHPEVMQ